MGRRVEGRDKGLIQWQGKPLIAHVAERIRPQVCTMLISCNRNLNRYADFADQVILDRRQNFQGPLAGLEAAIPHISTSFVLLCACDTPSLPNDLMERLLAPMLAPGKETTNITFAHDGEHQQYLCALFRRDCLQNLSAYLDSGQRAVHRWYRSEGAQAVDFSDAHASFENYNNTRQLAPN